MQGEVLSFREFIYCIDIEEYNFEEYEEWQLKIEEQKLSLLDLPIAYREYCDVRSRGAAKTWIEMLKALYLASLRVDTWQGMARLRGYWYSTSEDQLDQPREYFDHILDHSFLKYCIRRRKTFLVVFKNYGKLKLTILTAKKARSGRADFAVFDEEAGLITQKEKELYDAAIGVLSGTWFGLRGHISTPCMGSKFKENHDQCKQLEYKTGRVHTFKLPWWDAGFLAKNKEFYEQEERTKPRWWYLQEYCAEFTIPMGAVFQNVIYESYTVEVNRMIDGMPKCSGVDWNPAAGHVRSTVRWSDKYDAVVVVGEAMFSTGYARELKQQEFYALAPFFTNGNRIVLEDGGINIPYIDWFHDMHEEFRFNWRDQQYTTEEWDNQDIHKMAACVYIIQNGITIYCDKIRFPKTAKQIEECAWDKDALGNPKLKKDPANSPHYLDAFLHAISELNRDEYKYEAISF